jgi:apolipoprotein D and lipocalin family protein
MRESSRLTRGALCGLGLMILAGALSGSAQGAISPAKPLDPTRYVGRWYEVARIPNKLQTDCVAATSDWSRQPDGVFNVVQTCHMGKPSGPTKIWRGAGRIIDALTNSRFRIGFFGGFVKMDYQVLDRGDDYSWCILTAANPKYLWIMSRHPTLAPDEKAALVARAQSLGYNTAGLVYDNQAPTS